MTLTPPPNPHEVPHMINVVACDCYSHGISVEPGDFGQDLYLTTWYRWHSVRILSLGDLKQRLKFFWEILTEGKSSADCLILTKTSTNELITELEKVRNEVWPEEERTYENCGSHFTCPDGEECWYLSKDFYADCIAPGIIVKAKAEERKRILEFIEELTSQNISDVRKREIAKTIRGEP